MCKLCPFYLFKLPVVFLNGGHILSPDVHPETLILTELPQYSLGVGVGWVGLAVLLLPGLWSVKWGHNALLITVGGFQFVTRIIHDVSKHLKAPSWLFPWKCCNKLKSFYCTGGQISPPSPLAGPWTVSQPGQPPGRTVRLGWASSLSCWSWSWESLYITTEKCSVIVSAMSRSGSGSYVCRNFVNKCNFELDIRNHTHLSLLLQCNNITRNTSAIRFGSVPWVLEVIYMQIEI